MLTNLAGLHWWRIVPAAVVAFLGSMLVTVLIVAGYAFTLGYQPIGNSICHVRAAGGRSVVRPVPTATPPGA